MALTIVEIPTVTGGVDTHADAHVAAALNHIGGLLGVEKFPDHPGWLWPIVGLDAVLRHCERGRGGRDW
jgi:hypothetical protein